MFRRVVSGCSLSCFDVNLNNSLFLLSLDALCVLGLGSLSPLTGMCQPYALAVYFDLNNCLGNVDIYKKEIRESEMERASDSVE